ncbi:MAG: site-specific integrase [Bacteroidetes bacterium]|nr:site-specific integrase [Bacteroidota bacterium]
MKASRITYKNEQRIKIEFPYNSKILSKLKTIPDARWSKAHKAWHIPYTKTAFNQLLALFPDLEYTKKDPSVQENKSDEISTKKKPIPQNKNQCNVTIQIAGQRILIKLPRNDADIHFIKSLRYSRWDKKQFSWVLPNYPGNLDLLNDYFKDRIQEIIQHPTVKFYSEEELGRKIGDDEILIVKTNSGRLKLFFGYNKDLTRAVKGIPYYQWHTQQKYWSIPYSEKYLQEIKAIAEMLNLKVIYEEEKTDTSKVKRIRNSENTTYRKCPPEYLNKLTELRYSPNTIKTYKNAFEEFINYYSEKKLEDIDETLITNYLKYLVMERKVSISYQNQAINSIKFYYERVLKGERKIYYVDRPRKEQVLPEVLSEEEVTKLIQSTENLKHRAILMLAYSTGMRLSELLNVKIKDIDSKRMQIRIEQGKGRKDRYARLSSVLLDVLRRYFKEYKPVEWLIEGINGGKYSARSIQQIMKMALKKAGIKKKASVHTLRHTFATHLLENGVDIRYIQVLLGHESSKTTEIYTHVTTKGFDQIKNPLDKLKL